MEDELKPTTDQIAFVKTMTGRQMGTLRALAYGGPFFLSASERGDPEMYVLIQKRLARCWRENCGVTQLWTWEVTPTGRALADQFLEPALMLAAGPS